MAGKSREDQKILKTLFIINITTINIKVINVVVKIINFTSDSWHMFLEKTIYFVSSKNCIRLSKSQSSKSDNNSGTFCLTLTLYITKDGDHII